MHKTECLLTDKVVENIWSTHAKVEKGVRTLYFFCFPENAASKPKIFAGEQSGEYRNSDISEPWPESTSPQPGSDRAKMRGSKT